MKYYVSILIVLTTTTTQGCEFEDNFLFSCQSQDIFICTYTFVHECIAFPVRTEQQRILTLNTYYTILLTFFFFLQYPFSVFVPILFKCIFNDFCFYVLFLNRLYLQFYYNLSTQ